MVTLRNTARQSLVRYYVALKLNAGAVAPILGPFIDKSPSPIVRRYSQPHISRWHPLEIISVGNRTGIITMAGTRQAGPLRPMIGQN